jgi:hypothetical protein
VGFLPAKEVTVVKAAPKVCFRQFSTYEVSNVTKALVDVSCHDSDIAGLAMQPTA